MSAPTTMRRSRWLATALAGAVLLLLLQTLPSVLPALEYRRALLLAQPWRLITGHLVHLNWMHALVNAAAWLLLAALFRSALDAKRQLLSVALGAAAISLALAVLYPSIAWYRGASGALHALFFAGASAELAAALRRRSRRAALVASALLAGGAVKLMLELPDGASTPYAEWLAMATVPQAHLVGALSGCLLGLLFARARPG
jgi:rhomboid family GlyGly-CTERM serine protease